MCVYTQRHTHNDIKGLDPESSFCLWLTDKEIHRGKSDLPKINPYHCIWIQLPYRLRLLQASLQSSLWENAFYHSQQLRE